MRVIALDPGYERLGIAIIEKEAGGNDTLLYSDCFQTLKSVPFEKRLEEIGSELERLIALYTPTHLAMEQLYFNQNQKTALKVSEVRGTARYIGATHRLIQCEYTPSQVKNAVIGYGKGTKEQVAQMVRQLVSISKEIRYDDEFDAIAVGLTCTASERAF